MEGKGSGDTDLGERSSGRLAFWGVAKGLEEPSESHMEMGAALL
jgi:hypothetical protein